MEKRTAFPFKKRLDVTIAFGSGNTAEIWDLLKLYVLKILILLNKYIE